MELSKFLTIVIPCKNESKTIDTTLTLLNFQDNVKNVNVIISDSSDDGTTYELETRTNDIFNFLELIKNFYDFFNFIFFIPCSKRYSY